MIGNETIFLTGFPGFIASRLLRRLAGNAGRFLLLVQPAFMKQAQTALSEIANQTQQPIENFRLLEGDISQTNLGLSSSDFALARAESTIIFHLAALYDLAVERESAMRVNVMGTGNVNLFAQSAPQLRHYHYVSTCYVAGKRQGLILETELKHNVGFRNHYEETKYLAETEVEALKSQLPITIHRPSVVCGDSVTGETAKFDGIYYLIRYLLRWPSFFSIPNIGNRYVRLNLVPIDFVVESLAMLAREEAALGKTLQLADSNPLTTRQLFDLIATEITGHGSRFGLPPKLVELFLMSPPSPALTGLPHSAVPYFFLAQTYDTSTAAAVLNKAGVHCPPFSSYVHTIAAYAASHPE